MLDADDPTRPVGVLDWEMATVGDPLMDLGGTMAYWVQDDDDEFFRQFRRQPTNLPGMLSREEVVDYYCERMGYSVTPEQWRFYEVYGLFRLGVIAQQIYYRYFHEQTTNEAYAIFGPAAQLPRAALQRDHRRPIVMGQLLLVRHGQASWDADDYDVLSPVGWEQSAAARARSLAGAGSPGRRRARAACGGTARPPRALPRRAGRRRPSSRADDRLGRVRPRGDAGDAPGALRGRTPTKAEFQEWFEAATDALDRRGARRGLRRVVRGVHRAGRTALRSTADRSRRARRSCSPAAGRSPGPDRQLLADAPDVPPALAPLNPVCVNSGVTRLVTGRRGTTLVTFNEHAHLDGVPAADLPLTR